MAARVKQLEKEIIRLKGELELKHIIIQRQKELIDNLQKEEVIHLCDLIRDTDLEIKHDVMITPRSIRALEILKEEENYISALMILVKYFRRSLLAHSSLKDNDIESLFFNMEELLLLNTHFADDLVERFNLWNNSEMDKLGDIFTEWAPRFEPYCRFGAQYDKSLLKLDKLMENPSFHQVMSDLSAGLNEFNGKTFREYFMLPIERVPMYELLVNDLLSKTPKEHVDYPLLKKASKKMKKISNQFKSTLRHAEGQIKFRSLLERGDGFETLASIPIPLEERILIDTIPVLAIYDLEDPDKLTHHEPELIILNDIIVASNFLARRIDYQLYCQPLKVVWCSVGIEESVKDLFSDRDHATEFGFVMGGPEFTWVVFTSPGSAQNIVDSINTAAGIISLEHRVGIYQFINKCVYDGSWRDGNFFGSGKLTNADGIVFDGYWDPVFSTGFGIVTDDGHSEYTGWLFDHTEVEVIEKEYTLWGDVRPDNDTWKVIDYTSKKAYLADDVILYMGETIKSIYRVKKR
eukprot:TRINITY_DN2274_c0_g1_i5.p2 TRINITY_DN2274_c0_g1~~TRINITY_DN2274_c0_g1_i5.p2  ORF type:complete len:521 (+),score=123.45 TRINITY_DN2274_c0_g1_i5:502-2064(+)